MPVPGKRLICIELCLTSVIIKKCLSVSYFIKVISKGNVQVNQQSRSVELKLFCPIIESILSENWIFQFEIWIN